MAGNCEPPYPCGTGGFCDCTCGCCPPCPCYDNIDIKYPYGVPKANVGAILLASQLLQQKQQQQPQQPQVVYYIPQPQPQAVQSDIVQNVPQANEGGEMDDSFINDFW